MSVAGATYGRIQLNVVESGYDVTIRETERDPRTRVAGSDRVETLQSRISQELAEPYIYAHAC
jgi:hypothetical protein